MNRQRRLLTVFRRVSFGVAICGAMYLAYRFDVHRLPEDRPSPVAGYAPGERLIVDGKPPALKAGDTVLVQTQSGVLEITRIEQIRDSDGRLWCVTDRDDVPGLRSATAGWIDPRAAVGRVLLAWEF